MKSFSIEDLLRRRIIILTGLIFILSAFTADYVIKIWLEHELDEVIESKANHLTALVKDLPEGVEFDFADAFMPEFSRISNPEYFEIWTHDFAVFEKSRSLKSSELPYITMHHAGIVFKDIILEDGRNGRMAQVLFTPQIPEKNQRTAEKLSSQKPMILAIAMSSEDLDATVNRVHIIAAIAVAVVIALLNFIVVRTVRKGFQFIRQLKEDVASLDANNLSARLNIDEAPEEFDDLIARFNSTLAQLENAFSREKQFSSDVAHELKTPIAELRSMSEIALKWPGDANMCQKFFSDTLASSRQMQHIVDSLLSLARCENSRLVLEFSDISLNKLVANLVHQYEKDIEDKALSLTVSMPEDTYIKTSRIEFEIILNNLLANAFDYSTDNSQIILEVREEADYLVLSIQNTTTDIDQEDLTNMFNRLWRKSTSRSSTKHTGLGLSIVKAYADVLDIAVIAEIAGADTLTISLHIRN
jgi:signal transduction histidine kinase